MVSFVGEVGTLELLFCDKTCNGLLLPDLFPYTSIMGNNLDALCNQLLYFVKDSTVVYLNLLH